MPAELPGLPSGGVQGPDASEMGERGVSGDHLLLRTEGDRGGDSEIPLHRINIKIE